MNSLVVREIAHEPEEFESKSAGSERWVLVQVELPDEKLTVRRWMAVYLDGMNDARVVINPQVHPEANRRRIDDTN